MRGSFTYCNPTKLYFGKNALQKLAGELDKYGPNVQLIYGGGSIKKNGIYDQVMEVLTSCGKNVVEDGGVMPNPTVDKLREGVQIARTMIHGRNTTSASRNRTARSFRSDAF